MHASVQLPLLGVSARHGCSSSSGLRAEARPCALRRDGPCIARGHRSAVWPARSPSGSRRPTTAPVAAAPQMVATRSSGSCRARWGCCPVSCSATRRESFVELYSYDNPGKTNYGTAGYLGDGYFITVKHGVVALDDEDDRRRAPNHVDQVLHKGKVPAKLVDAGDADVEVHRATGRSSRYARARPAAAQIDSSLPAYDFAEPIFRLGNDYSKGIILWTGYVGQRTANGSSPASPTVIRACRAAACWTRGRPGGDSDRPDAGRLPLLVHPAAAARDVPQVELS